MKLKYLHLYGKRWPISEFGRNQSYSQLKLDQYSNFRGTAVIHEIDSNFSQNNTTNSHEHRMHKQRRKIAAESGVKRCGGVTAAARWRRSVAMAASSAVPAAALGGPDKIYGHFPFKTILRAQLGFMSRRCCSDSIYSSIFHTITHTRITSDGWKGLTFGL